MKRGGWKTVLRSPIPLRDHSERATASMARAVGQGENERRGSCEPRLPESKFRPEGGDRDQCFRAGSSTGTM